MLDKSWSDKLTRGDTQSQTSSCSAVLFSLADNWAKNNAIRPPGLDTGTRYGNATRYRYSVW